MRRRSNPLEHRTIDDRIHEERTDAARVRIRRVEDHPIAPADGENRVADGCQIRGCHAVRGAELDHVAIGDSRRTAWPQPESDLADNEAAGVVPFEAAHSIPESALRGRE